MVFIRIKTRFARGSAAKARTNENSVRADRRFRADDKAIRSKKTILSKPLAAVGFFACFKQKCRHFSADSSSCRQSYYCANAWLNQGRFPMYI